MPVLADTKGMLASRVAFTIAGIPPTIMTLGICMIPCAPCARNVCTPVTMSDGLVHATITNVTPCAAAAALVLPM